MSGISGKFLRPNLDDQYYAQVTQIFHGLWTPYGLISPLFLGIYPDGGVTITYSMKSGASFTKMQKRKIEYVQKRGVEVHVMNLDSEDDDE